MIKRFNHYTVKTKNNVLQQMTDIDKSVRKQLKPLILKSLAGNKVVPVTDTLSVRCERIAEHTLGVKVYDGGTEVLLVLCVPVQGDIAKLPVKVDMPAAPVCVADWGISFLSVEPTTIMMMGDMERCFAATWFDMYKKV